MRERLIYTSLVVICFVSEKEILGSRTPSRALTLVDQGLPVHFLGFKALVAPAVRRAHEAGRRFVFGRGCRAFTVDVMNQICYLKSRRGQVSRLQGRHCSSRGTYFELRLT